MKPPVAVLGANGQVGLFAIDRLLKAGREVIAVTRQSPGTPNTSIEGMRRVGLPCLVDGLNQVGAGHGLGPPALLSCGPVGLALELLAGAPASARTAWERAVVVGTTSIPTKRSSPDEGERRVIGEIEGGLAAIRRRCEIGGIPLTVLHPTLIYGCGVDRNLSRVFRWIRRAGFAPLAPSAAGRRQPLHVEDLANTIVNALEAEPAPALEAAVCGGSTLSYRDTIGFLFEAAGRRPRFLRLPESVFGLAAGLSKMVPGIAPISSEMFRRQSRDLVFDDTAAREELGHSPRPFRPTEADFRLPPHIESIRKALL